MLGRLASKHLDKKKLKYEFVICCTFSFPALNNARRQAPAPAAHMSTGPAGGGGSENILYVVLVGAACLGGGIYVSNTSLGFCFDKVIAASDL